MESIIAGAAFILTLICSAVASFKYIAGVKDNLTEKVQSVDRAAQDKMDALRREAELRVEKVAEGESKARHDLANTVQGLVSEVKRDVKSVEQTLSVAMRDMIRRSDLGELEARIMAAFERGERSRGEGFEKLEKRMNAMDNNNRRKEVGDC